MSVETHYKYQLELLQSTLDFHSLHGLIHSVWHEPRPAMALHNGQIDPIRNSLVREVAEASVEREREGNSSYDAKAEGHEATDVFSYLMSIQDMHRLPLTGQTIWHGINGYGERSDIFDRMTEAAGNIEPATLTTDVAQMFRYVIAYIAGMPQPVDIQQTLNSVVKKNTLNYPAQFFNGLHPQTQRPLNPEELHLQYDHSLRCIKLIRFALREIKLLRDRDYGLKEEDWQKYMPLIADFDHSDLNLAQLLCDLKRDLLLTEAESHRLMTYFTEKVLANQC